MTQPTPPPQARDEQDRIRAKAESAYKLLYGEKLGGGWPMFYRGYFEATKPSAALGQRITELEQALERSAKEHESQDWLWRNEAHDPENADYHKEWAEHDRKALSAPRRPEGTGGGQ